MPQIAVPASRQYGQKRPKDSGRPLVVHFHGGAFTDGNLDSGSCMAQLLEEAGAIVLSLDYPLAPANPFPAAVEAGYAALETIYKQRTKLAGAEPRLFVAGEEAGGTIAAAVALIARDRLHPPLAGQILVAPMLDPCTATPSLREALGDSVECKWSAGWQQYLRGPMDAEHPYAVPGRAKRVAGLPPTLVLTGADDPFRDEAIAYGKRLADAGIRVTSGLLQPTTGWPESLADTEPQACPCADEAREYLRAFFQAPTPPPD